MDLPGTNIQRKFSRVQICKLIVLLLALNSIILISGIVIFSQLIQNKPATYAEIQLATSCDLLELWVDKRYSPIPSEMDRFYTGWPFMHHRSELKDLLRQAGREAELSGTKEAVEISQRLLPVFKSKKWEKFGTLPGVVKVQRIINSYCPNQ